LSSLGGVLYVYIILVYVYILWGSYGFGMVCCFEFYFGWCLFVLKSGLMRFEI